MKLTKNRKKNKSQNKRNTIIPSITTLLTLTILGTTIAPIYAATPDTIVEDTLLGTPLTREFLPISPTHRPTIAMTPEYITIHNTANNANGANAEMHARYLQYGSTHESYLSWHFTVDDHEVYQHLPINEIGYHAGDGGSGTGNRASIGIEICENEDGDYRKAEENAENLVAELLFELDMDVSRVVPHKHWSGKECPENMLNKTNGSVGWDQFIENVANKLKELKKAPLGTSESLEEASEFLPKTEALKIGKGQTMDLGVYKTQPVNNYQLYNGKEGLRIRMLNNESTEILKSKVPDGYHPQYTSTALLVEQDYDIPNGEEEFKRLMTDKNVKILANENFMDVENRSYKMTGLSYLIFKSDKGTAKYAVYSYLNEVPTIMTKSETEYQVKSAIDLISTYGANTTWTVKDNSIVKIENGKLYGLKKGETTISTNYNGIEIARTIQVE